MTLADDLKPVLYEARAIMGELGMRPYRIFMLHDYYSDGQWLGPEKTEITELGGQPPKMVTETFQDLPPGAKPPDVRIVGPITPVFPGGGTDLSEWIAAIDDNQTRHFLAVGPDCPDGKKYRVLSINTDKALRYMVRIQSEAEALQGFAGSFG
jgi:hypothetical protein